MTSKSGQVQKVKKVIQVQSYDSEVTGGHHHIRIKEIHKATTSATVGVTSGGTGAGVVTWHGGAGRVAVAWWSLRGIATGSWAATGLNAAQRRHGGACAQLSSVVVVWHGWSGMGWHSGGDVTTRQGLDRNVTWWVCPGLWGWAGVVVKGMTMSK
ncbi:hypothetical protein EDB89DRAFT_1907751 [Lactarius sanguifluus]|nr:hypothetical protein EDB89DRAFT_1907751 [Lactarius sanguifluus]